MVGDLPSFSRSMDTPEQFPNDFSVVGRRDGPRLRVWLSGDIDIASRDVIDALLNALIEASGLPPTEIRFHMSHVTNVDSSDLTVLMTARRLIHDHGDRVVVERPPPLLTRLLEITALDQHFTLETPRPMSSLDEPEDDPVTG
jgi:anti-anti-sigma factor